MAKASDRGAEVAQAAAAARAEIAANPERPQAKGTKKRQAEARRIEAMTYRLAGYSNAQIAKRLEVTEATVQKLITETLRTTLNREVGSMREMENYRLDHAQAAIWRQVSEGDLDAVKTFIKISQQRAMINGLNAPRQLQVAAHFEVEMHTALEELKTIVLAEDNMAQIEEAAIQDEEMDD